MIAVAIDHIGKGYVGVMILVGDETWQRETGSKRSRSEPAFRSRPLISRSSGCRACRPAASRSR